VELLIDLKKYKMDLKEFVRQNEKMNSSLITNWSRDMLLQAMQMYADEQLRLYRVSNSSDLYVVELSDEEIRIVDQKELDEWYKSAEEFDGFLGFTIKGKLMK
jgi:hypothetical protein